MRAQIQAESLKNDEAGEQALARRRRSHRELGAARAACRPRARAQSARRRSRCDRHDPLALEGSRDQRRARSSACPQAGRIRARPIEHFDAALKKDPDNKIVQYWKAQLDGQTGAVAEATKSLEAIVREKPVKELDPGMSLMSAAQSALANLSLRTGGARRRHPPLRGAEAQQPERHALQGRPLAIDHRICRPRPVAHRQARDRRALERPKKAPPPMTSGCVAPISTGSKARMPPRCRPARLRAGGQSRPIRRPSSRARTSC